MNLNICLMVVIAINLISCGGGAPKLGGQIDRMGRPAINTALNKTFTADATRDPAEDTYNATDNAKSVADFKTEFAANLAIYDSLVDEGSDGNACGDNPLTNRSATGTNTTLATGAGRYALLAAVLADDQLYINSGAGGTCNQYLAAELVVMGVSSLSTDCGGRTPTMDVIKTTYSAVAAGAATGVDDGVVADTVTQSNSEYPFLAAAQ